MAPMSGLGPARRRIISNLFEIMRVKCLMPSPVRLPQPPHVRAPFISIIPHEEQAHVMFVSRWDAAWLGGSGALIVVVAVSGGLKALLWWTVVEQEVRAEDGQRVGCQLCM